jgi:hypothetical protein
MLNLLPPQWRDPMQWVFVCAASFVRGIGCFMRYAGFFCVVIGMGGSLASLFSWTSEVLTLPFYRLQLLGLIFIVGGLFMHAIIPIMTDTTLQVEQ